MTEEKIKARLVELKTEKEKHMAFINVLDGAIQDCEYWLGQTNSKETNGDK